MSLNVRRSPVLKMADISAKRERKIPKRFIDEFVETKPKNFNKMKTTDRNIYPVEITQVDKARNMVKIHFKGYSEKFDEWRPCDENNLPEIRLEPMSQPTDDSLSDRPQAFCERVYREIKRKLYSVRREDPEVRIEIQVDDDVFNESLGKITSKRYQRNKLIYEVLSNETLDCFIGTKWNERIMNENGDFAYVVPGTLRFWLTKRNPVVGFKLIGNKYVRSEIEDGYRVVFTFVCGDGNRFGYKNMVNH